MKRLRRRSAREEESARDLDEAVVLLGFGACLFLAQEAADMLEELRIAPAVAGGVFRAVRPARARRLQQDERGSGLVGRIVSRRKTEMPGRLVVFGVVPNEGPRHDGLLQVTLRGRHAVSGRNPTTPLKVTWSEPEAHAMRFSQS
jgi:hypothetical protein